MPVPEKRFITMYEMATGSRLLRTEYKRNPLFGWEIDVMLG
jgi:hypothetical protein